MLKFRVSTMYLITLFLFFISNAFSLEPEKIVGEQLAKFDQFKYSAFIQAFGSHVCGGAIIGEKYVLTAAQCFYDRDLNFVNKIYVVVARATVLNDRESLSQIERTVTDIYHPKGFRKIQLGFYADDIAVLQLDAPFNFSYRKYLIPLNLPTVNRSLDNVITVVTGYGYHTPTQRDARLRYGHVQLKEDDKCFIQDYPFLVCGYAVEESNDRFKGLCEADTGNILVHNNTAVAVASHIPTCDQTQYALPYIKVSSYVDFIQAVMKDDPVRLLGDTVVLKPATGFWSYWFG